MTVSLRSQAVRRRDVIVLFAGYPLATLILHQLLPDSRWYGVAHVALVVALIGGWGIPRVYRVGRALGDDLDASLDERQLSLRNAAYLDAFRIAASIVLLGIVGLALGADTGYWPIPSTYTQWNDVFWAAFILLFHLPGAILAWREPDPEPEAEAIRA